MSVASFLIPFPLIGVLFGGRCSNAWRETSFGIAGAIRSFLGEFVREFGFVVDLRLDEGVGTNVLSFDLAVGLLVVLLHSQIQSLFRFEPAFSLHDWNKLPKILHKQILRLNS